MTRISLIAGLVAGTVLASPLAAKTLIVSHGYPPTHDIVTQGFEPLMACIREQTGNAIDFNYFPSGQIASTRDSLDAVNSGLSQISSAAIGYLTDKMPLSGIAMLPSVGGSSAETVKAFRKMLDDGTPLATEFEQNKVIPIAINMLPTYQVISAVGPIRTLADFQGKVLRSGGGTMSLAIGAIGASPVEMSGGDMYVAMQRGTLDASILSLSSIKPYNLQELANAISANANFGTFPTIITMDKGTFEGLPAEQQTAIRDCGRSVETSMARYLDDQDKTLQQEFATQGIDIYTISDADITQLNAKLSGVAKDYIARLAARGLPAQEVYDAYSVAMGK